jgi:hypothetical protein
MLGNLPCGFQRNQHIIARAFGHTGAHDGLNAWAASVIRRLDGVAATAAGGLAHSVVLHPARKLLCISRDTDDAEV